MSLKHAILGFINLKSRTGYELKKSFDESVNHFWPADQSQIYRTLSRMVEEGELSQEIISVPNHLDRKKYHITALGKKELKRWLVQPLMNHDIREPFLIQIFFAGLLTDSEIIPILEKAIEEIEKKISELEVVQKQSEEKIKSIPLNKSRQGFFSLLTLDYGIFSYRMTRNWLKKTIEKIKNEEF